MKRRALLSTVACSSVAATAGCIDRLPVVGSGEDGCGDVDVNGAVSISDWADTGRGMHVMAYATSDTCTGELTLEGVADGRTYVSVDETSEDGEWRFSVRTSGQLPDGDAIALTCRDENGVVVGKAEVPIGRE